MSVDPGALPASLDELAAAGRDLLPWYTETAAAFPGLAAQLEREHGWPSSRGGSTPLRRVEEVSGVQS